VEAASTSGTNDGAELVEVVTVDGNAGHAVGTQTC
jgi:hypothetical protein